MATLKTALSTLASGCFAAIDGFFTTAGWVNTSDTGQCTPPAAGYRIWRLNDSLQSTNPWYLKVTYSINFGGEPGIQWQFSNSTDGAGNLNGSRISNAVGVGIPLNNGSSLLQNCYMSGANNRMVYNLWDGPTSFWAYNLGVERAKNTSGTDSNQGLIIYSRSGGQNGGSYGSQTCTFLPDPSFANTADAQNYWPAAINAQQGTMATGNNIGVGYVIPYNLRPVNHGIGFCVYQGTDFPTYTIQSLTIYGTSHSYLVCSAVPGSPVYGSLYAHPLMQYE